MTEIRLNNACRRGKQLSVNGMNMTEIKQWLINNSSIKMRKIENIRRLELEKLCLQILDSKLEKSSKNIPPKKLSSKKMHQKKYPIRAPSRKAVPLSKKPRSPPPKKPLPPLQLRKLNKSPARIINCRS